MINLAFILYTPDIVQNLSEARDRLVLQYSCFL